MGFLEEVESLLPPPRTMCSVTEWASTLSDEDRKEFEEALNNPLLPSRIIWAVMVKRGYTRKDATVQRHRKGSCACGIR